MTMLIENIFSHTLQKTEIWIKEIMNELNWNNPKEAYVALKSVLHVLRDRLIPDEALHLSSQLPMLVRGFYFEGWNPSQTPVRIRTRDEFLDSVIEKARAAPWFFEVERVVSAIFGILCKFISPGEMIQVASSLPRETIYLWPPEIQSMVFHGDKNSKTAFSRNPGIGPGGNRAYLHGRWL